MISSSSSLVNFNLVFETHPDLPVIILDTRRSFHMNGLHNQVS